MNYTIPDGSPMFQKGWKDGCENGLYSRANALYRTKYNDFNYDPSSIDNPEYRFGYGKAYGYCFTMNTAGGHGAPGLGGADAFIYGRGVPFDMGRKSIDETLNYEAGSWNNAATVKFNGVDGNFDAITKSKGFSVFGSHPLYGTPNDQQIFGW